MKASEWRKHVGRWKASGITAATYCAEHGLNAKSLQQWSWRFGREDKLRGAEQETPSPFAQVRTEVRGRPTSRRTLRLTVGSVAVEIPPEVDDALLRRVLSAVIGAAGS